MAYNYEYPYVDPNRYNDDWAINKVKELDETVAGLEAIIEAHVDSYIDDKMASVIADFNQLKADFETYKKELDEDFDNYKYEVNARLTIFSTQLETMRDHLEAEITGVNARTDLAIEQNNTYLLDELSKGFLGIKVINYFTGDKLTIQEMFDYLCTEFHTSDAFTVSELVAVNKTVNELIAYNASVTELVSHGKSIIV